MGCGDDRTFSPALVSRWCLWAAWGLAVACAAASLSIDTTHWAEYFHHPLRQPMPGVTLQGAALWRAMLLTSAAALVIAPLVLSRINQRSPPPGSATGTPRRSRAWTIVSLLLIAFSLRAMRIGESLWYDEIASWLAYGAGIDRAGPIVGNYFDPVNHVFHTLLSWLSVRAFSTWLGFELSLRLPALMFSLLAVPVLMGLGRAALGERAGVLAAGLAAVLPVCVLEGAEARGYSMMIFFSAAASWTLLAARRRADPSLWLLYACLCALGIWSHFVTAFVPIGHAVWLAWRAIRTGQWRTAFSGATSLALAAVLTITLYAPLLPDMQAARGMFFSSRGDEPRIIGAEGYHALLQLGGSWYWWAAVPGLLLAAIGFGRLGRTHPEIVAATMLGLPVMVVTVALSESWLYARFTLFALPGAVLLIAAGLDHLWSVKRAAGLAACVVLMSCSIADLALRPPKQPLREAAAFVHDHALPGQRVVIIGLAHEIMRAYTGDLDCAYSFRHGRDLADKLDQVQPAWVVIEYPLHVAADKYDLLRLHGYVLARRFDGWADWTHGDVLVYIKAERQKGMKA